jgi:hypothetical protein
VALLLYRHPSSPIGWISRFTLVLGRGAGRQEDDTVGDQSLPLFVTLIPTAHENSLAGTIYVLTVTVVWGVTSYSLVVSAYLDWLFWAECIEVLVKFSK